MRAMRIAMGFPTTDRPVIAALYWEAFGGKLGRALGQDGGREREPGDKAARPFLPQPSQQRRGADYVADSPELDDQNPARDGCVYRAIDAGVAVLLIGPAGNIAPEMAAVGVYGDAVELGHGRRN